MSESLLEKALAFKRGRKLKPTDEDMIPVALAWLQSEITMSQVAAARETAASGSTYCSICTALRVAYNQGLLIVKEPEK